MKMEIAVHSPVKGKVKQVKKSAGDLVLAGQTLAIVEMEAE